jgi:hypothetical protein
MRAFFKWHPKAAIRLDFKMTPDEDKMPAILWGICLISLISGGCLKEPPPIVVHSNFTPVYIQCVPAEAEIFIDDQYQGMISKYSKGYILMRPGKRRIAILKKGYFTYRNTLLVTKEIAKYRIQLLQKPE